MEIVGTYCLQNIVSTRCSDSSGVSTYRSVIEVEMGFLDTFAMVSLGI